MSAVTGEQIVAEAMTWIGTPFHWQASLKGVGCDCKGFVWGVARALGLPEAQSPWPAIADYDEVVPVDVLLRGLGQVLARTPCATPGDVLLLRIKGRAQHLAILTGPNIIHCLGGAVIETRIGAALRAWPQHSAWRFPSRVEG